MPATHVLSGAARFAADAVDALLIRSGRHVAKPSDDAQRLTAMPLSAMAAKCLELMTGQAPSGYEAPEAIAERALAMSGAGWLDMHAEAPSWNRPGDFPNLLAGLANKMLDQAIETSDATYPLWTARAADLPDFKPATVVGIAGPAELDEIMDDEEIKQAQMNEELAGWIQVGRYGNSVACTPVMVANDDLDGFGQAVAGLAAAHERTLNRLCLNLIGGNVATADGFALYDAINHQGNDIIAGAGGAPSIVQAGVMKLAHRRQLGIGGLGRVKTPPKIALVPSAWEEAAMQTFLSFERLNESKLSINDATINTFRGSIEPVVEPDLEDASLTQWYTFADPRIRRTIVHAFQRGYGNGGKRSSRFVPERKSQVFELEGRFAAAIVSWRGTVRNAGV